MITEPYWMLFNELYNMPGEEPIDGWYPALDQNGDTEINPASGWFELHQPETQEEAYRFSMCSSEPQHILGGYYTFTIHGPPDFKITAYDYPMHYDMQVLYATPYGGY